MTVNEAEKRYLKLQAEAKEISKGLKEWNKRYKRLCKSASALAKKLDYDQKLYVYDKRVGDAIPDGWNCGTIHRLYDFEDYPNGVESAQFVCENLTKVKFRKGRK